MVELSLCTSIQLTTMKKQRTVVYHDPLNDDFAGTNISHKPLPHNYRYLVRFPLMRGLSFLLYWGFAKPLLFLTGKLIFGVKVKGKKNVKRIRHKGYFIYSNHTHISDGWAMQAYVTGRKRTYIVANQDASSIPGIRYLVKMLGCLPVPEQVEESKNFQEAIGVLMKRKHAVSIYPEAHIWPYYTHIRPFKEDSFVYPATIGTPVLATCLTFKKRRVFRFLPPHFIYHVSKPFYPDMSLSLAARKKQLRDQVYDFMLDVSCENENHEVIHYVYEPMEK